jgi:hypothetical protein
MFWSQVLSQRFCVFYIGKRQPSASRNKYLSHRSANSARSTG